MDKNSTDTATKKNDTQRNAPAQQPGQSPEKHKKNLDDNTRNSGFRSSRIRNAESRTQETGDPSVP
ncbi:MAG TPA: hypothetical protein VGD60_05155 [Candidatus Acidoferrales bacterium]